VFLVFSLNNFYDNSNLFTINSVFFSLALSSCNSQGNNPSEVKEELVETPSGFYYGADLSYINEMEDCETYYKDASGNSVDLYQLFKNLRLVLSSTLIKKTQIINYE
jgi:arabinogalactan endo-1,4-beta-galactosidase